MNLSQSIFLDEFREHVLECERVINDRPLQQVGETEVITPSMLLYGRKLGGGGTLSSLGQLSEAEPNGRGTRTLRGKSSNLYYIQKLSSILFLLLSNIN